jgi:hypothetical protein
MLYLKMNLKAGKKHLYSIYGDCANNTFVYEELQCTEMLGLPWRRSHIDMKNLWYIWIKIEKKCFK